MQEEVKKRLETCGVDVDGALERMVGNEGLFMRMMKKFIEEPYLQNLKEKLEQKDYNGAFADAHTLKGVAGNLGLNSIMEADHVIVEKLRNYTEESVYGIEEDLKKLEEIYVAVCEEIETL